MSFMRALAICASSSRASTCSVVMPAKLCTMRALSSSRFALRLALASKRGSVASCGFCSTWSQKIFHSRSFCRPSITVPPSPTANGP